jgi:predicted esterase
MSVKIFLSLFVLIPALLLAVPKEEERSVRDLVRDGMAAYSDKDYEKAIENFKKAHDLQEDEKSSAVVYNIACCYALLGDNENAMNWLEKAYELGVYKFSDDEDLVSLKEDKKYQKLEKKASKRIKELEAKEWKGIVTFPEGFDKDKEYPVVVALHGFGTSPVGFSRVLTPSITSLGYILYCPYGPEIRGSTAFGWGEIEQSEKRILDAIERLKKNNLIDTKRIILFGYSQGGGRAFYMGLKHPKIFQGIISAAGAYYKENNEFLGNAKENGVNVYAMIGEKDNLLESNQKAEEEMKKARIPFKLVVYPGIGHAFPPNSEEELKRALEWVENGQ